LFTGGDFILANSVYISHSTKDREAAGEICAALEADGIRCWIAPRDIKPGEEWPLAICKAITSSEAMIIIFSKNANTSKDVANDIILAMNTGVPVVPIKIEQYEPTGKMLYYLAGQQWYEAISGLKEEIITQIRRELMIDEDSFGAERSTVTTGLINPIDEADKNIKLRLIDSLKVNSFSSQSEIQFCVGDLTCAGPEHTVDVLITSAFRDCYLPVPGSVFNALFNKGVSVDDLANDKEVDLRGAFSCWLSREIVDPPKGLQFKRILCYEPSESAKAGEQIGDIFRSLAPFIGGQNPIRVVATTLVAAGASRRISQHESLQLLVDAAVHWISSGLPIKCFKIICLPDQDVDALTCLFSDLKSHYESVASFRQEQPSYDFFISYSHKDTREVDLFVDLLMTQNRNLRLFIDKKKLNPGSAWQKEIYEAIDDCQKVAAFFSPTYLDSKVCLEEFNIALCRHRESEMPVLAPVYLYSANLPTYMKLIQFFDCRESNRDKLQQTASLFLKSLPQ
jgi:hypothetical protein